MAPVDLKPDDIRRIAKALADPQRCAILEKIARMDELCCSDLLRECQVSQATISHHFKELLNAGLVERRKDGQFVFYRFRRDVMRAYLGGMQRRLGLEVLS